MVMAAEERFLTVSEVAARLRITPQAVRLWLGNGTLRGVRLPAARQGWRISEADLDEFLRQHRPGSEAPER
jgi:excisionase family DNA binding protein